MLFKTSTKQMNTSTVIADNLYQLEIPFIYVVIKNTLYYLNYVRKIAWNFEGWYIFIDFLVQKTFYLCLTLPLVSEYKLLDIWQNIEQISSVSVKINLRQLLRTTRDLTCIDVKFFMNHTRRSSLLRSLHNFVFFFRFFFFFLNIYQLKSG
jgi:hypothetical protein